MNTKKKFRIAYPLTAILITGMIIAGLLLFQSCEQEEMVSKNNYDQFLDTEIPANSVINAKSFSVIEKARQRIEPYVNIRDGQYKLQLSSGYEINISEKLFSFFEKQIDETNRLIKKGDYISYSGTLIHKSDVGPILPITRLKSGPPESDDFDYEGMDMETYISWSYCQVKLSHQATNTILSGGIIGGQWLPDPLVSKIVSSCCVAGAYAYNTFGNSRGLTLNYFNTLNTVNIKFH